MRDRIAWARDPEPNRNKKHSPFRGSELAIQVEKPSLARRFALRAPLRRTARAARGTFDGRFEPRLVSHAIASRARLGQTTSICLAHTGRAATRETRADFTPICLAHWASRARRFRSTRFASRSLREPRMTRADSNRFEPICLACWASRARHEPTNVSTANCLACAPLRRACVETTTNQWFQVARRFAVRHLSRGKLKRAGQIRLRRMTRTRHQHPTDPRGSSILRARWGHGPPRTTQTALLASGTPICGES